MPGAGGQHHTVARLEANLSVRQGEGDRARDAVEDLLVRMGVVGVHVARPVGPRVAALGFLPEARHEALHLLGHHQMLPSNPGSGDGLAAVRLLPLYTMGAYRSVRTRSGGALSSWRRYISRPH